jgi:ABC-type uncharacterized transport system substrate-binding protein
MTPTRPSTDIGCGGVCAAWSLCSAKRADNRVERLPALATEMVRRRVAVIAATTTPAALAAKAATTTIPIVFETAANPVKIGLVSSLNRPGGNVTGVTQANVETGAKCNALQIQRSTSKVAGSDRTNSRGQ